MRTVRLFLIVASIVAVSAAIIAVVFALARPRVTEESIRTVIVDTILREDPASFLVTGTLTFSTEVNQESGKTLLPGILNLDLGTTIATVRAPGRAAYGFDTAGFDSTAIRVQGDSVFVRLPPLLVYAVEPDLTRLDRKVDVGWARLYRSSGQEAELQALRRLQPAMRLRAEEYLLTSPFPRTHTENAMADLLTPVLRALGMEAPVFHFEHTPAPINLDSFLAPENTR